MICLIISFTQFMNNIPSEIFFKSLRPLLCYSHFNVSLARRVRRLFTTWFRWDRRKIAFYLSEYILYFLSFAILSACFSIFTSSSSLALTGKMALVSPVLRQSHQDADFISIDFQTYHLISLFIHNNASSIIKKNQYSFERTEMKNSKE